MVGPTIFGGNAVGVRDISGLMAKKEVKSGTEFTEAAKALDEATNNGADCDGALANSTVKADVLELNNCSASAQKLCGPPANVSESEAKNCVDILELSVNSTKVIKSFLATQISDGTFLIYNC